MDREILNQLKTKVMTSYRFIGDVFDGGIDDYDQFQSFTNLCENYLDLCNFWCECIKPKYGWLQYQQMMMYRDLYETCFFTINDVNQMLSSWKSMYDAEVEESKQRAQYEERMRLEQDLAMEFRDRQYEYDKNKSKMKQIGFVTTYKRKNRKKRYE